jgi:hypothetical protein
MVKILSNTQGHWYWSKKPGLTVTSSAIRSRTSMPRRNSLSRLHSLSPSISSTGGAPSRGCLCLGVTGERSRRDQQPFLAPASHRAAKVSHAPRGNSPLVPLALEVHREQHGRQTEVPTPSMPPSPLLPVTVTFTNPASRRMRWASRSKPSGGSLPGTPRPAGTFRAQAPSRGRATGNAARASRTEQAAGHLSFPAWAVLARRRGSYSAGRMAPRINVTWCD